MTGPGPIAAGNSGAANQQAEVSGLCRAPGAPRNHLADPGCSFSAGRTGQSRRARMQADDSSWKASGRNGNGISNRPVRLSGIQWVTFASRPGLIGLIQSTTVWPSVKEVFHAGSTASGTRRGARRQSGGGRRISSAPQNHPADPGCGFGAGRTRQSRTPRMITDRMAENKMAETNQRIYRDKKPAFLNYFSQFRYTPVSRSVNHLK
jgi:hypothetical protein